ncbi:MAG: hypothetical protein KAU10_07390 [Dehalococcoidia bacterium]|nr:hypothetical protein [Dehalococcoidia bacterium]
MADWLRLVFAVATTVWLRAYAEAWGQRFYQWIMLESRPNLREDELRRW